MFVNLSEIIIIIFIFFCDSKIRWELQTVG